MVTFKRLLDIGVQTLLVPYIQTAEEARNAVLFTRYRPQGVRGYVGAPRASNYDRVKGYAQPSAEKIGVLLQVETVEGPKNIEESAKVEALQPNIDTKDPAAIYQGGAFVKATPHG